MFKNVVPIKEEEKKKKPSSIEKPKPIIKVEKKKLSFL